MKIHEYQAKELLRKFGVALPEGRICFSADEAVAAAKDIGGTVVVKAQIHAGGRGKGGGVKVCKDIDEVRDAAQKILGMTLVTHQTGPEGKMVGKVLVEKGLNIDRELYLGITLDRAASRVTLIASTEGGMEIEKVATKNPEKIHRLSLDPLVMNPKDSGGWTVENGNIGVDKKELLDLAGRLNLDEGLSEKFFSFASNLSKAYIECDCSLVEINPLAITKEGEMIALDAKVLFDDNAIFRHQDYVQLTDLSEENPLELEAKKFDLNYISLSGNIGCMVNGAGLAMATMDIIKLCGGEPANFLDVGGGATKERVAEAFKLILHDPNVKAVLINIFGGIVKCDMIAEGISSSAMEMGLSVPLVVRLQGTNVEAGRAILKSSGLNIISAEGLSEAAEKVVDCIK
ncbi:MAG: ADP-forming succinate--CoA ligase subunit beta [Deltaproteobacteria bacterium CG11_big_fil_rev_8_21_14_0_20_49_13]|nr:MAG: ADP-forming succinate--CoA ligase subunit beta [Deltaproteobacteria bacterium CG11_big_fil_rev_8_21_14_0_20_49_13]